MSEPTFICPVCGYPKLDEPPTNHNICACCGTQFEYDDYNTTHAELRARWIAGGMPWFSDYTKPPMGWNPNEQLKNLEMVK